MRKVELLAPAGNMEKLNTACHFGADSVYMAGNKLGLRAYAGNFDQDGLKEGVEFAHKLGKKVYVTVNVFAYEDDFECLDEYLTYLEEIGVDAVIVSDVGIVSRCLKNHPNLPVHLSTQASTTNSYSIEFWRDLGVKRIVLAREVSLDNIKKIRDRLGETVELEAFVHGAMCMSYSGRCLLSNYLVNRGANRGECVQACRWEYAIHEVKRPNKPLILEEDERGSYILNSRDLNMMAHLDKMVDAGLDSLKIEGRMKTAYYVGTVVNAYRRALDKLERGEKIGEDLIAELDKAGHRSYTTGFYFGSSDNICLESSQPVQDYEFSAYVLGYNEEKSAILVEQRNRFVEGERLQILSPDSAFCQEIEIKGVTDTEGNLVEDAKRVQQKLYIPTEYKLHKGDILRKKLNA
ncbi:MAG: U32 family peptidase [Clostridia bacterium]|nr:U32 family peptidase [Clostridia bacterium]